MKKKRYDSDLFFDFLIYAILGLILLMVLYPLIYIVSASFSSADAIYAGKVWLLPSSFTTIAYETLLGYKDVFIGYRNTIFYTVFGTLINLTVTLCAAYPLSVKTFVGRKIFMKLFTFTMLFGGGLIPYYIVVRNTVGVNNIWCILIPGCVGVYQIIIARTNFQTSVPYELYEAGTIDGLSDFGYFIKVLIPCSKAVIAVLTLMFAVSHWNSYFGPLIFLNDKSLYPLQLFLRDILISNSFDSSMLVDIETLLEAEAVKTLLKYSLIVVSTAPILCLYPFVQKYFVKGMMIGSVKG